MATTDSVAAADRERAVVEALAWASSSSWPPKPPGGVSTGGFNDIAASLAAHFSANGLEQWAARLDRWLVGQDDGGTSDIGPDLADILAETGIRLAADGRHPQLIAAVDDLWTLSDAVADPVDTLVVRLQDAPETHPLMLRLTAHLADGPDRRRRGARASDGQDWKATTRNLWPGPYEPYLGARWPFVAAARLWPGAFLTCLDAVPPEIAHAVIAAAGPFTPAAIENLIAFAPPAYDGDGQPIRRPAIFALLDEIPAAILRTAPSSGADVEPAAMRSLEAIVDRADFALLGRTWLQHLTRYGVRGRHGWEDQTVVREALLWLLAQQLPALPMPLEDWIAQEEPLWQVDRLLAEVAIALAHDQRDVAATLLAEGIAKGWVTSTGRDRAVMTDTMEGKLIRATLGPLADPAGWFEAAWLKSYDARERQTFLYRRTADDIASVVLAWAVAGLNGRVEGSDPAPYWHRIVEALCEDQLSRSMASVPTEPRDTVVRAAALIGLSLHKCGLVGDADLLRLLAVMAEPSERFARLVELILSAEGQDVIDALAAGIGPETMIGSLTTALRQNEKRPAYSSINPAQRSTLQTWLDRQIAR